MDALVFIGTTLCGNAIVLLFLRMWLTKQSENLDYQIRKSGEVMRDHCDTVSQGICRELTTMRQNTAELRERVNKHGHRGLDGDNGKVTL